MTESASTRVLRAVAEATGRDPATLPPLYEVVDPDALDALFDSSGNGGPGDDREFRFSYAGREVSVRSDEVVLGPASDSRTERFDE